MQCPILHLTGSTARHRNPALRQHLLMPHAVCTTNTTSHLHSCSVRMFTSCIMNDRRRPSCDKIQALRYTTSKNYRCPWLRKVPSSCIYIPEVNYIHLPSNCFPNFSLPILSHFHSYVITHVARVSISSRSRGYRLTSALIVHATKKLGLRNRIHKLHALLKSEKFRILQLS